MQELELEQAAGDGGMVAAVGAEGKTLYVALASGIITTLLGMIGWLIKNTMARQRRDDTANNITVETLTSARARISELEAQVKLMLNDSIENAKAQIAANSAAQRAADNAIHASALAEEAQRSAVAAQAEAGRARALLAAYMAYARQLRSLMIDNGLTPPPEPEP